MKIKQKLISCVILGAGLIGAALSLIAASIEPDAGGLLPAGHPVYYVMCVLSAGVLGYLFYALRDVKGMPPYRKLFPVDVRCLAGYGAGAFGLAFSAYELYLQAPAALGMAAAISGFLAAGCMIAVGCLLYLKKRPHYVLHAVVTIHLMLLLIHRYQLWNTEPQLMLYLAQLMASLALMPTFYHRTALDAGIGKRRDYAFFGYAAAFFCCLAALAEMTVFHLAMAAWCLTNQCSLVRVRELPPMKLPEEVLYCMHTLTDAGVKV